MSFSRGKISVCMATCNGERFIKEQLDSILIQISTEDEVVISDDGSTDETLKIIKRINDSRIKIFNHVPNTALKSYEKVSANFFNAINHAKGDFLFLVDQDDIWMENKVKICVDALLSYDLILHDCKVVKENLEVIHPSYFKFNNSQKGILRNVYKNAYLGCCMAFRKEIATKAIGINSFCVPHDIWLGLTAELSGKVKFLNEPLLLYRRHYENISYSAGKSKNSFANKILYRIKLVIIFIKHYYL